MKRFGITLFACMFLSIFSIHAQEKKKVTKQETVKETTKAEAPSASEKKLKVPTPSPAQSPKKQEAENPTQSVQPETPANMPKVQKVETVEKVPDEAVGESVIVKKKKAKKPAKQKTPAGESKK